MRSSNICRSARLLACLAAASIFEPVYAIDPNRAMSQYVRSEWTAENGFPGGAVSSIAQTNDGFLWIGTEKGLVRFDGVTFRLVQPSPQTSFANAPVLGLIADRDGSLWARLHGPTLLRYPKGAMDYVTPDVTLANSLVTAMCHGADGTLLISSITRGVMAYRRGQFEPFAARTTVPASFVISIAQTPNGDLWLGTRDVGLFRLTTNGNGQVTAITENLPDRKINCILPGKDQELWIGSDNGVVRWDGSAITTAGVPSALARVQALAMTRDRDENVWIAAGANGLMRVNTRGASVTTSANRSDITAIFEDREGNLWIGSTHGITRLRDAPFTTYSPSEGLPSESGGAIYTDADQRIWFAPPSGGLYAMRDGPMRDSAVQHVALPDLGKDVIYSIAGRGDTMWLGRQLGGLTQLRVNGINSGAGPVAIRTYTHADGLAQNSVYAVHQSRDGAVWAGTLSGGVSRLIDGRFTTFNTASTGNGLASNTITAIIEDARATMWFATSNGLSSMSKGAWKSYHVKDGLPSESITCLIEDPYTNGLLWIGTAAGVAAFSDGRISPPLRLPTALQDEIIAIEADRSGGLWITTSSRVVRVNRDKLLQGLLTDADVREFGTADGLLGTEGIKRHRSVSTDARGRIWFSMRHGLSVVDPARAAAGAPPAMLHVQSIAADGVPVPMLGASDENERRVRVPSGRQRITFSYVGLSLSVPERVRYRYKLEGFDREWSDPVAAREAVYTNLGPGPYRFHLMASNSDGLWSEAETSIPFDIDPAFWQTRWFQGATILAFISAVAGLYRLRMQSMTRQLNVRFEERLAERTRIAQELHDTLLQGFVSASMQLHVAADQVPAESPAKPTIDRVLTLMGRVIEEGRNAVRGLRAPPAAGGDDLEQAFYRAQQELAVRGTSEFRVIVEGRPRPLHPIVRDEVHRLGREALMNAFHHASAKHIEVELEYAPHHLRMLVRDDGVGIDPEVLQSGRQDHWGLSGMRERAERMGARLRLWSRKDAGTEVELSVPGHVAFVRASSSGSASNVPSRLSWLTRWRPRG